MAARPSVTQAFICGRWEVRKREMALSAPRQPMHGSLYVQQSKRSNGASSCAWPWRLGLQKALPLSSIVKGASLLRTAHSHVVVATSASASASASASVDEKSTSKCVLVAGATGGVGQLVTAALLDRGYKVRALLRDTKRAATVFGEENMDKIQVVVGDTRNMETIQPANFKEVTHVICCTGTTAFPSKRWDGDNTPEKTDWHGVRNLIDALPNTVQRFVLVSSVGVTKCNQLPWNIMNLFGVLKYKKMGEDYLCKSGLPFTIIRPGRLTDGPYTSYDLNTLLKATAGTRRCVVLSQGDTLVGEASRLVVAEACIQALDIDCTCGNIYEINSVEGDGPGADGRRWTALFTRAQRTSSAL